MHFNLRSMLAKTKLKGSLSARKVNGEASTGLPYKSPAACAQIFTKACEGKLQVLWGVGGRSLQHSQLRPQSRLCLLRRAGCGRKWLPSDPQRYKPCPDTCQERS